MFGDAWWVLVLVLLARHRPALAAVAGAFVIRLAWPGPAIHLHGDRAFLVMNQASNPDVVSVPAHGVAWTGLMLHPTNLIGAGPYAVQGVDAFLGALAAGVAWCLVRAWGHDARTAWFAAIGVATLPLHIAISGTETRFVAAATLQLAAAWGLARRDRAGDALLVLSAGLLAHLRPVQGAATAVFLLAAVVDRRGWAAAGIAGFVLWRLAQWWPSPPSVTDIAANGLWPPGDLPRIGRDAIAVVLDPTRTPVVAPLLALGAWWRRPSKAVVVATTLGVVDTIFYLSQSGVADRLRMELPAVLWCVVLGAVAAGRWTALADDDRATRRRVAALAVAWTASVAVTRPYPPYTWQAEHALLRRAAGALPAGATVAHRPGWSDGSFTVWAMRVTDRRWISVIDAPDDAYLWVTGVDLGGRDGPLDLAGRPEVVVADVPAHFEGLEGYYGSLGDTPPGAPIRVGLYGPRTAPPAAVPERR